MPEVIIDGVRYEPVPATPVEAKPRELRELSAWRTYAGFDRTALLSALENRGVLPDLDARIEMTTGALMARLVAAELRPRPGPPDSDAAAPLAAPRPEAPDDEA